MDAIIIENIPFDIQAKQLYPILKIESNRKYAERLDILLASARNIACPRVAYKLAAVEYDNDGTVLIDGVCLMSRVMQVNFEDCRRAFPFIATCGMELEKWSRTLTDTLDIFWADTINMMALGTALEAFKRHLTDTFETRMTSTMNPGSLEDWPLSEQHKIFSILNAAGETIGVQLTESAMMVPLKSVSGIEFESGEKFHSCQLCPRDKCPSRRAPYDEQLYAVKYNA
ncbi:MAG: vitamin B12 dependent methionine synthase [Desulfobacteraceae bacterium]|nr:vitamin B12 dependent methionine synthase [Desulfobacteraceae bacterium]MBC2755657.1 vitamin B12 dependent methionine synthase [Desulfobacteraceae bacterium]